MKKELISAETLGLNVEDYATFFTSRISLNPGKEFSLALRLSMKKIDCLGCCNKGVLVDAKWGFDLGREVGGWAVVLE